ncbi:MAG: bifunctional riboflavin kinase/FAD synthetase [Chloroflexota bacterium]
MTAEHGAVVTIGAFDGVHRGHQHLVGQVVDRARALRLRSVGVTFHPHPDTVMRPERRLTYLTDPDEKVSLLKAIGLDHVLVLEFTPELSRLTPEEFLDLVERSHPVSELWVGSDFAVGRDRSGTIAALAELGAIRGYGLHVVPPRRDSDDVISSTAIRGLLATGAVAQASQLLGRPYRLTGTIEHGAARGRTIGFPTANVRVPSLRQLPGDGVYATVTWRAGAPIPSVANLGPRPTFAEHERLLEVHLLDFHADVYGETVSVEFIGRVRGVQRFSSVDELRVQIQADTEAARRLLAASAPRQRGVAESL